MAKSQWPVDGTPHKSWKVTSPFGWRMHPIKKVKKHHNGVDIWQGGATTYLEAWADGKVVAVKPNNDPNSAGHSIIVQSTVMGKKVTWTYFHMVPGSIKVKVGQKIEAGTIVGKMGESGFATGKHLHWEIWAGHIKAQPMAGFHNGKGYYDAMEFCKAVMAFEKANVNAHKETPESATVTVAPTHSLPDVPTVAVPTEAKIVKADAPALIHDAAQAKKEEKLPVVRELPPVSPAKPKGTPAEVVALAKSFAAKKYREGKGDDTIFGKWYGANHNAWCAMFVSYIFNHAGAGKAIAGIQSPKGFASCTAAIKEFKKRGQWHPVKDAQPGDIIFFDWEQNNDPDHVGIVVGSNNPKAGTIQTVEGNTSSGAGGSQSYGDGVFVRTRYYKNIVGVARPYPASAKPATK